jgi:hypothetical protein
MKICTIDRGEILLNETDNGSDEAMDIDHAGNHLDNSDIPKTETFKCLLNVDLLEAAFVPTPSIAGLKAIVILREYEFLRELLERESNDGKESFHLVIGHPGTGSSNYCSLSNHTLRFCTLLTSCRQKCVYPLPTPLPP